MSELSFSLYTIHSLLFLEYGVTLSWMIFGANSKRGPIIWFWDALGFLLRSTGAGNSVRVCVCVCVHLVVTGIRLDCTFDSVFIFEQGAWQLFP